MVRLSFDRDNPAIVCMMKEEQLSGRDAVHLSVIHELSGVLSFCSATAFGCSLSISCNCTALTASVVAVSVLCDWRLALLFLQQ